LANGGHIQTTTIATLATTTDPLTTAGRLSLCPRQRTPAEAVVAKILLSVLPQMKAERQRDAAETERR
jgi:hypothetical protein